MEATRVLLLLCVASFCKCDVLGNVGVYGGRPINIEQAPYMAQIRADKEFVCGGSIIHERFVLTAANCILPFSDKKYHLDVIVGTNNKSTGGEVYGVQNYMIHPSFNPNRNNKDINVCLIELSTQIEFNNKVNKIKLARYVVDPPAGTMLNLTGWGKTEVDYPNKLMQATIPTVSSGECQTAYKETNVTISSSMMCAGNREAASCYGDGGGPLTSGDVVVGVVSYRYGYCGQIPTVFTKVAAVYRWIQTEIHGRA